jgi:hypothetical protein
VILAALCAFTVIAVTVVLLFVLRPRDEDPPAIPTPLPTEATVPTETSTPTESVPPESLPTETAPAETAPAPAP